jgi:predicted MFS family arabinose efflux permease
LLGGLFVDQLSWRWVFYVNLPVGAAAMSVIAAKLPRTELGERKPVDARGALLLTAAASTLVLVCSWGGTKYAWDSATILILAAVGVTSLAAFVATERKAADPVLPLELFKTRAFSAAATSGFLVGMSMFGAITFLPLYLQVVDGASATEAGLRMLPFVIGSLIAATISGKVTSKVERYKPFPVAGAALMVAGLLMLSRLDRHSSDVVTAFDMLVVGVGIGLVMQTVILVAQNHSPRRYMGVATSTATFGRSIGASIGVAILGAIFASRLTSELSALGSPAQQVAGSGAQLDPARVHALPPAIQPDVIDAFTSALSVTLTVGAAFAAAALAAVMLLPRTLSPEPVTLGKSQWPRARTSTTS